ncbi:MAG: Lrp/AsnC family transcriptional regulator [Candidatus Hadarchaeales archaeon]
MQRSDTERKILLELLKDSSRSIVEIARATGISRQTVAAKLRHLKGKIRFTIRLNSADLGLSTRAYVFIKEKPDPVLRKRLEDEVKKMKEVGRFYRLFGRYSSVLEVLVRNEDELSGVIQKIHRLGGIEETETFIVRGVVKEEPEEPFIRVLQCGSK